MCKLFTVDVCGRFLVSFVVAIAIGESVASAQQKMAVQEGANHLAKMALKLQEASDAYECSFYVQSVEQPPARTNRGVMLQETIVRQARDRTKSAYRSDVHFLQEGSDTIERWSHELIKGGVRKKALAHFDRGRLRVMELDKNDISKPFMWTRVDAMSMPLSTFAALRLRGGFDVVGTLMQLQPIECSKKEGRLTVVLTTGQRRGGAVLEFRETPDWLPVKVEHFSIGSQRLPPQSTDFAKEMRKGVLLCRTVSRWEEIGDDVWAPEYVRMAEVSGDGTNADVEIVFSGWEVGADVSKELFADERFSIEALRRFSFEDVRKSIAKKAKESPPAKPTDPQRSPPG